MVRLRSRGFLKNCVPFHRRWLASSLKPSSLAGSSDLFTCRQGIALRESERVNAAPCEPGVGPADAAALQRHCAERLADHKVPENIKWRAAPLRRHANGKVMKRLRREPH